VFITQVQCDGCKLTITEPNPITRTWLWVENTTGSRVATVCPDCFAKTGAIVEASR
jgi:hypothetical protein